MASFDGGGVQGTAVESKGGEPAPPDGIAILLPQQTEGASDTPSMAGYQSGDFRFGGVAPGEYLLFSVPRSFAWDWSDPALLAELRRRATKVKVSRRDGDAPKRRTCPGRSSDEPRPGRGDDGQLGWSSQTSRQSPQVSTMALPGPW
ncbi:MAG: hypothetical protein R2724_02080 [Bryobacterales bacterium]